ncbi:MAG: S1C family serine protease [Hyphomicrobiaceae bacterium]
MGFIVQPVPENYDFDLDRALAAVVGLRTLVPADGFTAETLGTERLGHGVLIRKDGIILTIGYLVTEATEVWIKLSDGRYVQGHVLGYDQETGFGLVQALARIEVPFLPLGSSAAAAVGEPVVLGGTGGRPNSVAAQIVAKQEFAGYWEYVLDQAIFTAPSHPHWGGTAMIGSKGELLGIGSLQVQHMRQDGTPENINMVVPIDILKPILDDLIGIGRPQRPARPWLGLFATEVGNRIAVAGISARGPAKAADVRTGDIILDVAGKQVHTLAGFFRSVWARGQAGVDVPLTLNRRGKTVEVTIRSGDRRNFLKGPVVH